MKTLKPRFKFWLESDDADGIFGGGKYRLLKAIDATGSLSAAAEELKISYRKAWGDLKKAEAGFEVKLIDKVRGGAGGGKTSLTDEGRALMRLYDELRTKVSLIVNETFEKELNK
jgi:molybdate transport repressor ModE-like protein